MSGVLDGMDGISPADIAERWFARLMASDCTLREREVFEVWLRQTPENALAFEEVKALWSSLDDLHEDEVIGSLMNESFDREHDHFMGQWTEAVKSSGRHRSMPRRRPWLKVSVGVAATLIIAVLVVPLLTPETAVATYLTSNKIESAKLADGSTVHLDLDTVLEAKLDNSRRDIVLKQGRVVFDVAKDARRPFVVDTGVGSVTALGTEFQVQREGSNVSVMLIEGSVGIDTNATSANVRSLRLVPGQKASYASATRSWTVEPVDASAAISWSDGFHVFGATPLRQALDEINRYSDVKLVLVDPAVGDLRVSGSFKLGDGKAIAEALPYALPVNATERAGRIVISKR